MKIRVKRDGPRGWHWIAEDSFDPEKHERMDTDEPEAKEPAKRKPGRPRKTVEE